MSKTATRLRPGFSAWVRTTNDVIVATVSGNVNQPEELFLASGADVPDNLRDGEYERLAKLGAFDPLPPRPVSGVFDPVTGALALAAEEGDGAKTTPSDIRVPTDAEVQAQERLAQAQEDVRKAFEETQNEGLVVDTVAPKPTPGRPTPVVESPLPIPPPPARQATSARRR